MKTNKTLIILRGLPGSGKDHWVRQRAAARPLTGYLERVVCSADDYFVRNGDYQYDPKKLAQAHEACKGLCVRTMLEVSTRNYARSEIIINNTNTERWEYEVYELLAELAGYQVRYVNLYDGGCTDEELAQRNQHGLCLEKIRQMRERYMDVNAHRYGGC